MRSWLIAVGHDVADEDRPAVRCGEVVGRVVDDAGDGGRAVVVRHISGTEPEPVVGLAEAWIPAAAEELVDRLAVAVARVEVAERVEAEAERVDLAVREVLQMRAVGPHPVDVAGLHRDRLLVARL